MSATKTCNDKDLQHLVEALPENLDFILGHFEKPLWPRTISTRTTQGRQISVYSREEALARFEQANLLDCRINAYPLYTGFGGINRQPPNFVFIDIDRCKFKTERAFWLSVEKTCKNIKQMISGNATVLWTGNGVHIDQPVKLIYDNASTLEEIDIFSEFKEDPTGRKKDLSTRFMRFAEELFTGSKYDPDHRPSVRSCLLRVPGTLNSKCIDPPTGNYIKDPEVRIIQMWDGQRPAVNWILRDFRRWLINEAIKDKIALRARQANLSQKRKKGHISNYYNISSPHPYYGYIEKILQTPIDHCRRKVVSLIIIPYLVVIKKIESDNEIFNIARDWLDRCNQIKPLDRAHDYNARIRSSIASSRRSQIRPMGLERLGQENKELYNRLQ
jgi:Primase X